MHFSRLLFERGKQHGNPAKPVTATKRKYSNNKALMLKELFQSLTSTTNTLLTAILVGIGVISCIFI